MGDNYKLYSTLGLNRHASADEIKRAYKKMAFEFHPDKNKGNADAEAKFKEISQAYNVLSDENEKNKYDQLGDNNYNNGGGGGGGNGGGFRHPHQDIFESFFRQSGGGHPFGFEEHFGFGGGGHGGGNGGNGGKGRKCASIEKTITMTLDEVYEGVNKQMSISVKKYCISCNKKCDKCDGRGQINQVRNLGIFTQVFQGVCDQCEGAGVVSGGNKGCKECKGAGSFMKEHMATLIIPAGVDENYKTLFPELGEQPKCQGQKAGDLHLNIRIDEHKQFVRKGNDLHYKCDIGFVDSVIGKDITIPYFKETVSLNTRIFGVLAHHKKYLLEGKGLPIMNTGNKGNMYIEFNINYPKIKNEGKLEELKKCLEETFYPK